MISAPLYQYIYILIVALFTVFCFDKYCRAMSPLKENKSSALICAVIIALFIGFRPVHPVFFDTVEYARYYDYIFGDTFSFSVDVENLIFDNLLHYMSSARYDIVIFFLIIALIFFVVYYIACVKIFPNNSWAAYLVFLGAFLTFASAVNGIKAGAAASLFICAIAYRENKPLSFALLALSWGFHHSMIICLLAYIVVSVYKNTKAYSILWILALVVAIAHITFFQEFFANYVNEKGASYLITEEDGGEGWYTGMRYDFVLYSFMPILVGWHTILKKGIHIPEYTFVFNLYLLLNALWMLCMYANFTNRIAALSWCLYPIIIIYPFLSEKSNYPNKNKMFAFVMLLHLAFTLFMIFVY